jgi:hypothetical protein
MEEGRRFRRPLIVAMSLQPPIPQRVARQQSPPPLPRLGAMLRLGHGDCQYLCALEFTGQGPPSGGWLSDPQKFELRQGFQPLQAVTFQRLILDPLRNLPTNSTEEPIKSYKCSG